MKTLKELIPEITSTHGTKLVRTLIQAATHKAREDGFCDPVSGEVEFVDFSVLDKVLSDEELRSELESLFWKIWPAVADQVTYEMRKKWQKNRDLEKRLKGMDEIKQMEELA